jgi:hypothetical protein
MTASSTLASADARLETIARLNDRCRQGLDRTARINMTSTCLGTFAEDRVGEIVAQAEILAMLRAHRFSDAEAGERNRGSFDYRGTTVYFCIDYHDAAMENGSEDPADASQTRRVLTIMLRGDL